MNKLLLAHKFEAQKQREQARQIEKSLNLLGKVAKSPNSLTVPTYVLVGFLGSGKTTLMGQLIEWCVSNGLTPGLVINEFGSVSIDGQTLRQGGLTVTELSNGCICCNAQGDLVPALIKMALNPKIDLLLVEATGLADPADMLDTLTEPALWRTVEVGGIISVVDSRRYEELADDVLLARRQVEFADVLVLSKCDLTTSAERESLKGRLSQIAPRAHIFEAENGKPIAGIEELLSYSLELGRQRHQLRQELMQRAARFTPLGLKLGSAAPSTPSFNAVSNNEAQTFTVPSPAHSTMHTVSFDLAYPLDRTRFEQFLAELPPTVYRAKGFFQVAHDPMIYMFQQVPGFVKITPFSEHLPLSSRAVFIGQELDPQALEAGLNACHAQPAEK